METFYISTIQHGLPWGSMVKNPPANAGDADLIPSSGRSPGEENGNPLQYSCLGNPTDRGTRRARVHGVTEKSDMTYRLNNKHPTWQLLASPGY